MESVDTSSPAFKQWFGKSKVIDDRGKPKIMYHGTFEIFGVFKVNKELGAHFGTEDAAYARVRDSQDDDEQASWVREYYLSIKNPLDIPSDLGDWDDMETLRKYLGPANYEIFTTEELKKMKTSADVKNALIKKGYDGVRYINSFEDRGNASWIAFYPWQIKSVNNKGTWNKNNPNINESAKSDIIAYLELTPSALQPIIDKYAIATAGYSVKDGKTVGIHRKTREIMGRKLWEDMTYDERRSEVLSAINDDLKAADKESAGLDALPKDKVNYYLQRAMDFLDPMSALYKMLLKDMGATITSTGGVKLPKHLIPYIKKDED